MKCPACHWDDTKVNDSRLAHEGMAIRRRRECLKCSFRFTTNEEMEILNLSVIKRDGRSEPYSRDKLEVGLKTALEKRPVITEDFKKLVSLIEQEIQGKGSQEIRSSEIGEIVIRHLKEFDQVAYIRFASVYRSFKDAQTFQQELDRLTTQKKRQKNK
ncbi:MAG: transcriptional regulator NrdR [Patescibacteria group bacterium]